MGLMFLFGKQLLGTPVQTWALHALFPSRCNQYHDLAETRQRQDKRGGGGGGENPPI